MLFFLRRVPIRLVLLLCPILVPGLANADEESEYELDGTTEQSFLASHGKANYLVWVIGPRTEALSGNKDGKGTALNIEHYFTVGALLAEKLTLNFTALVIHHIDEKPEEKEKQWQWSNPYFTLTHGKLFESERHAFKLDGYLRYYVPVSRNIHDNINKGFLNEDGGAPNDTTRGEVRLLLNPTKSFLDGSSLSTAHFSPISSCRA